jgi:hypothetical protein
VVTSLVFAFCFSILGMYLFGGKFCMWYDGTRECSCHEIVTHDPKCVCDRKHFNNILWATVTVFQVGMFSHSLDDCTYKLNTFYILYIIAILLPTLKANRFSTTCTHPCCFRLRKVFHCTYTKIESSAAMQGW